MGFEISDKRPEFRLNSPQGKAILALARGGDYAHPAEEKAMEYLALQLPVKESLHILDVGCGRGGSANWFQAHHFGHVTGLDIDQASIAYAQTRYPKVVFRQGDVSQLAQWDTASFDVIYLLNSFYAFPNQPLALQSLRNVAKPGTLLLIYDYTKKPGTPLPVELGTEIGNPIVNEDFAIWLESSRWKIASIDDLTDIYNESYIQLLQKFRLKRAEILHSWGHDWYDFIMTWYGALQGSLAQRNLGGALFTAIAVE